MEYKPKIVKARLHTAGKTYEDIKQELKGQGFTCKQMKAIVRQNNYFDGLVLYLSLWNYDNYESWHLWNWDDEVDEKVMLALYEAEQYHPTLRYKNDFEQFKKDWENREYDPGCSFTFPLDQAEVLEVIQEEEDNIDHEAAKRQVETSKDVQYRKQRRKRMGYKKRANKGNKYQRKYF